jgi:uncharacterized protein (DUF302 family)
MEVLNFLEEDDYGFMMERTEEQRKSINEAIKKINDECKYNGYKLIYSG